LSLMAVVFVCQVLKPERDLKDTDGLFI
jgi:hypothetical protein